MAAPAASTRRLEHRMKWFWQKERAPKQEPTIPSGAIRRKLRYTGKVQAVGFRFSAQNWARERGLTGWVSNLVSGDVMLEVQGTPEQVQGFIDDVAAESAREKAFIHATLVQNDAVEPVPEAKFVIRNVNF